jgi:hypothetical protein
MKPTTFALLAVAGAGLLLWTLSGRLTFRTYVQDNGTWTFAVYRGRELVYTDPGPFNNETAASVAALEYIRLAAARGGA